MLDLKEHIGAELGDAVNSCDVEFGELTVNARRAALKDVITFLKSDGQCKFETLIDLCGVDYPARERRFDVVYHLLSMAHNQRIRVKITTDETEPVRSIVELFPCANWFEREAFDMYGIIFDQHPATGSSRKTFSFFSQVRSRFGHP